MFDASHSSTPEPAIDVRAQQIAGIYAKAFLGAAQTAGHTADGVAELDTFVTVLNDFPEFETLLKSSFVKHQDKIGILDRVLDGRFSPFLLDFLKVVSSHSRLDLVRQIHREVRSQYDAMRGRKRVRVTTAAPLSSAESEYLMPALRAMLKGEPEVELTVDPTLIGGIVLRIGDTVYDGSVTRQLEQVREQMINRSVHEIQSRRDSFRYPNGN